MAIQAARHNPRTHPAVVGLWRLWCPVAAAWFTGGADPIPQYVPHPLIRAVEDYASDPETTLKERLEQYGLSKMLPGLKKYIDDVKTARQRLPHIHAPELLPTFPGGLIPLDMRMGIGREIAAFGGEDAVLEYVRIWAYVIDDWRSQMPFPQDQNDIRLLDAIVPFAGWRRPLALPVWAWVSPGRNTPWALFSPPAYPVHVALLHEAQSAGKTLWPNLPQIYEGTREGLMNPAIPSVEARALLTWLNSMGKRPPYPGEAAPAVILHPHRCEVCPFRHMCFDDMKGSTWTPSPALEPWIKGEEP